MRRAAVVIGVDRAGALPVLQAAASGAQQFSDWAQAQGFEVTLLTDAGRRTVSLADVKRAVAPLLATHTLHQLVFHFSGHGLLKAPGCEVWLLSGAPDDPDEAINLFASVEAARECGVPHVVFISDACRSRPDLQVLSAVGGGVPFPNTGASNRTGEVDRFFATRPGDVALEVPAQDAIGAYRAVYTDVLLDELRTPRAESLEPMVVEGKPETVIPAWRLRAVLEREVPARAARENIRLRQVPQGIIESHPPHFIARIGSSLAAAGPPPPPAGGRAATAPAGPAAPGAPAGQPAARPPRSMPPPPTALDALKSEFLFGEPRPDIAGSDEGPPREVRDTMLRLLTARGRESFETQTGFTVVGEPVAQAWVTPGEADVFAEGALGWPNQVRVRLDPGSRAGGSALIRFRGGTGTCLAVIRGFIGTVVVEEGRVVTVSYTPARTSDRYPAYQPFAQLIEQQRAFAAAAARSGLFQLERDEAERMGHVLRQYKQFDPTLGLYAAYAMAQAGRRDAVASIADYMRQDGIPLLFDIALLTGRHPGSAGEPVFPSTPMLTQGWSLLEAREGLLSPEDREVARNVVPSLWTTLNEAGVGLLRSRFQEMVTG